MDQYIVYILASRSKVIYVGITSDLRRRVWQHRSKLVGGFTKKYNVDRLVYFEIYNDPFRAITREKQIKGWLRSRKIKLIEAANTEWRDLYDEI